MAMSKRARQTHGPQNCKTDHPSLAGDLLWGCAAIGAEIGVDTPRANYLLARGYIPGQKIGSLWCSSRRQLRAAFGGDGATAA
jgi:hypothetical protein